MSEAAAAGQGLSDAPTWLDHLMPSLCVIGAAIVSFIVCFVVASVILTMLSDRKQDRTRR